MNHQEALELQAVERYLLDELTSSQKEAFEEHYFSCPECVAALREQEIFAANLRAVATDDAAGAAAVVKTAAAATGNRWAGWFRLPMLVPTFAALCLAVVALRQNTELRQISAGTVVEMQLAPVARDGGAVSAVKIPAGAAWIDPSIDLLPGIQPGRWTKYHWEVRNSSGKVLLSGDGENGGPVLHLRLSASAFAATGRYTLAVQGAPSTPELAGEFAIER